MTSEQYRALIKSFGLVPYKKCYDEGTIHKTRDGDFTVVPDPETLSSTEREDMIVLIKIRLGITDH